MAINTGGFIKGEYVTDGSYGLAGTIITEEPKYGQFWPSSSTRESTWHITVAEQEILNNILASEITQEIDKEIINTLRKTS